MGAQRDEEALAWIAGLPGATAARIHQLAKLGLRVEAERDAERARAERAEASRADEWNAYMSAAVSNAPEPIRKLGEYLAELLDEDEWATAEKYLNAAALAALKQRMEADDGGH